MKYTIIRRSKDDSRNTVQCIDANELFDRQMSDYGDNIISRYREVALVLESPEKWYLYKKMARVCPVSEYYRNKAGEHVWRRYNGVSVLEIEGLNGLLEIEKVKKAAAQLPQVIYAAAGADRHSVVVLTISTLPDGTLPKAEKDASLFCTQAYATSVQCLQPVIEFPITIKAPALDTTFLMTVDAAPYINGRAIPFIIEQPTAVSLKQIEKSGKSIGVLERMMPGPETYNTLSMVFSNAFRRAMDEEQWTGDGDEEQLMICCAEECARIGMPQEEVTVRLQHHFKDYNIESVRGIVKNTYERINGIGSYGSMTKHQHVAFRLREFLNRRYEIRFNEVMQMTEFRERQSLRFLFRELNRRELNTIHHEALLEGIEPTFGEVDELVHSTFIPEYNPIEDYLLHLPKWDGKDYIGELAGTVPTDNPYWERLFRQWFLSMVAHWLNGDESHANSTAPILIGAQGYRKSTFCRQLLPPEMKMFYTDSIDFRTNKEAERTLSRFMLVNIDEFDQLSEKQFAFVKHLFQKPASSIRRMYSETIATQRRYASFIGTTNSEEVLRDPTGNRRYLCVYVTGMIDTEKKINHAQLYSQAVHLIQSGVRYWINDEDEALIKETNSRFEIVQSLEMIFHAMFESPEETNEDNGTWMRSVEIMQVLSKSPAYNKKTDNNLYKLGRILTKLNLAKHRTKDGWHYLVREK